MQELLNTLIAQILLEPDYYTTHQKLYPDYLSMVQDTLQGQLENEDEDGIDALTQEQRHLLGYLNELLGRQ